MPNWCTNYVNVKCKDVEALAALMAMIDHKDGFFQQVKPCPEELIQDDLTTWGGTEEEQQQRKEKQAAMAEKYGSPSWYDWRITHWGTKWDVRGFEVCETDCYDLTMLRLQFETAWSPPTEIYEALKDRGYTINAEYVDEGMGFIGDWRDGLDQCFSDRESLPDRLSHLWPEYDEEGEMVYWSYNTGSSK
jgi:hypothetical protein